MQTLKHGALSLAALPLAAAQLGYAPAPSAEDTVTWEVSHSLALSAIAVELGSGADVNVPEIEMRGERARSLTMAQTHVAAEGGRPTAFDRRFESVEESFTGNLTIPDDELDDDVEGTSEAVLEGRTVRYRVGDDDELETVFVEDDGTESTLNAEWLEGLTADAHLGGILVDAGEAAKGEEWSAEPAVLRALIAPAGDLGAELKTSSSAERGFQPIVAGLDPLLGMDLVALLAGELEGSIDCKVESIDEDGIATIAIEVDVQATTDVVDRMQPWVEPIQQMIECDITDAMAFAGFAGDGRLEWNTETGLAKSLELELRLDYRLEREADIVMPDGEEDTLMTEIELEGTLTSRLSSE